MTVVISSGGPTEPWLQYARATVQILSRAVNHVTARTQAWDIYNLLHGKFGLILPAVTVDSTNYSLIHSAQIKAIQDPFSLGIDENGRLEFTTNYEVIWDKEA